MVRSKFSSPSHSDWVNGKGCDESVDFRLHFSKMSRANCFVHLSRTCMMKSLEIVKTTTQVVPEKEQVAMETHATNCITRKAAMLQFY
jgi:hypothetical protein